ncbi:2-amino-4-hydroxy-6-hydroxymethyldihydropteridine diphosphokinase [Treponema parvum]|uniref:2-amino-4-hydroxy-6-hydroxymethyldihydropteridine pyrophosphokinase n=1 Tax=Treponema parvum TaxID=138851 RepID=A0A975EYU2_9SPIR|nr:2-amino-4-hydroxy-6-hydroxymethyldihydropteridine diphosphokinase [Treponema parvum]QTQ11331.1 2-amino-4-hydroxy-6-hydroxymethyldihydropteridine diphosphokinase [Treponema parvum]
MIPVVLGLGSNTPFKGLSPVELLGRSCIFLRGLFFSCSQEDTLFSSVYRTKAMYVTDQSDFFNMAAIGFVNDSFSPKDLLSEIHKIESALGRDRRHEIRNGPRSMDIDIELFGKLNVDEDDLKIPHPRLYERAFVLIPILEILPKSADFIDREIFADKLERLPEQGVELYMQFAKFLKKYFPEAADGYKQEFKFG